jgi:hypothetical protein
MKRLFFTCVNQSRPSFFQRGKVVAEYLSQQGITAKAVQHLPKDLGSDDLVVFVKQFDPGQVTFAASKGTRTAYDIVDYFDQKSLPDFGAIIVANVTHSDWVKEKYGAHRRTFVMDHLHTNVKRNRTAVLAVKHVGFPGLQTELALRKHWPGVMKGLGLDWIDMDPYRDGWKYDIDSLSNYALRLDLGLVYVDNTVAGHEQRVNLKPSGKLTFMLSHGIPCLFTPHVSYMNVIAAFDELNYLIVKTPEDVIEKVRELIAKPELYERMSELSFQAAETFHMDRALELYTVQLWDFLVRNTS